MQTMGVLTQFRREHEVAAEADLEAAVESAVARRNCDLDASRSSISDSESQIPVLIFTKNFMDKVQTIKKKIK